MFKNNIQIQKLPKSYKIDPKKISEAPLNITPYFLGAFYYNENHEYFDLIKPYLEIPESSKSLKEIQQEFNDKIDELIVETKRKFAVSQQSADYRFKQFCVRQNQDFKSLKEYGSLPKFYIDYSKTPLINCNSLASNYQPAFAIKPNNSVGYYKISPDFYLWLNQKPSRFNRFFIYIILNWVWKDA